MPFVRIDYIKNQYSEEELTKISRVLQSSLVDDFDVPEKDCFQVFQTMNLLNFIMIQTIYVAQEQIDCFTSISRVGTAEVRQKN